MLKDKCEDKHRLILCYRTDFIENKLHGICLSCSEPLNVDLSKYVPSSAIYKNKPIYYKGAK